MSQPHNRHGTSGGLPRVSTTTSFLKRVKTAPAKPSNLTQQTVSVYALPWVKLKAFLEKRFPTDRYPRKEYPDLVFEEVPRKINEDKYVFMVPEALNSDDCIEINLLRNRNPNAQLEREQSLEP